MSFTKLMMMNPYSGQIKTAPVGASWTSLFFGPLVPLFRKDFSGFFVWIVFAMFTGGLSVIFQCIIYNKIYIKKLINQGYQVKHSFAPLEYVANKLNMTLPVIADA